MNLKCFAHNMTKPPPKAVTPYPHLNAALAYYAGAEGSNCVQRSAALMLDMPGATLVFGVMSPATPEDLARDPDSSTVPFIHAWVERGNDLYAPTLVERMKKNFRPIPVDFYYRVNGITKTWRLTHAQFMPIARRWKLASAFKHGSQRAAKGEVAHALLQAAGVRYVLSDKNTILPEPGL